MTEISDTEMLKVIGDFLEMGHLENIIALFKKEPEWYRLSGELLKDERFMVRIGLTVLFEELAPTSPKEMTGAIPHLTKLLTDPRPQVRGEACNLLGIINLPETHGHLRTMSGDPDPQVREIVSDFLGTVPTRG